MLAYTRVSQTGAICLLVAILVSGGAIISKAAKWGDNFGQFLNCETYFRYS